ncbi:MAG: 6-phosphogluconolactonase [Phycisphaerae bacterium]|nr:6-phosphogluconolactonase [Phycisphaerae bacterium]
MAKMEHHARVIVERTAEQATAAAANLFKTIVCEAVGQRHRAHVALAGGTTPHALYQKLAADATSGEVPWREVEVFFGDERDVPQDHVESNYHMAQRVLLDHVPIDPSRVHPMPADAQDMQAAAEQYEATIRKAVPAEGGHVPRFDLVLLGMGGDGHTASLFPNTDALKEHHRLVYAGFVPVLGRNRMTFTYPLINAARNVMFLVTGGDKAEAVLGVLGDSDEIRKQLPAAAVKPTNGCLIMVLDSAAARLTGIAPAGA